MPFTRRGAALLGAAIVTPLSASAAFAQTPGQAPQGGQIAIQTQNAAGNQVFTLGPGRKATITFDAFCMDFGKDFPAQLQGPANTAPDRVRNAIAHIQDRGHAADGQQALEAQYAVWQANGQTNAPQGTETTREILGSASRPPSPQGTSLLDAARSNQVQIAFEEWQPKWDQVAIGGGRTQHFFGQGRLTVTNTSGQSLTLYMPVGTVFPAANPNEQNMAGYANNIQYEREVQAQAAGGQGGGRQAEYLARTGAPAGAGLLGTAALGLALGGAGWLRLAGRHENGRTRHGADVPMPSPSGRAPSRAEAAPAARFIRTGGQGLRRLDG